MPLKLMFSKKVVVLKRKLKDFEHKGSHKVSGRKPPGKYVSIKKGEQTRAVASNIKELMKVRLERLYEPKQLAYETLHDSEQLNTPTLQSSKIIKVEICLLGDKGKGTTKFCFQPRVKDKNHSFRILSAIGLWDGPDNREFMKHFLNDAYDDDNCKMDPSYCSSKIAKRLNQMMKLQKIALSKTSYLKVQNLS